MRTLLLLLLLTNVAVFLGYQVFGTSGVMGTRPATGGSLELVGDRQRGATLSRCWRSELLAPAQARRLAAQLRQQQGDLSANAVEVAPTRYQVVVGRFASVQAAAREIGRLRAAGLEGLAIGSTGGDRVPVVAGSYTDEAAARARLQALRQYQSAPVIDAREGEWSVRVELASAGSPPTGQTEWSPGDCAASGR